jgi:hypothetical protein
MNVQCKGTAFWCCTQFDSIHRKGMPKAATNAELYEDGAVIAELNLIEPS